MAQAAARPSALEVLGSCTRAPCCATGGGPKGEAAQGSAVPCGVDVAACGFLPAGCASFLRNIDVDGGEADDQVDQEHQAHVFSFWSDLNEGQQKKLEQDFDGLDDTFFQEKFLQTQKDEVMDLQQNSDFVEPHLMEWNRKKMPTLDGGANMTELDTVEPFRQNLWRSWGLSMYAKRQVAIVIMHGGLDSRFGEGIPKGILDLGLISHKSIIQLYLERIKRLQHLVERKFRTTGKEARKRDYKVQIPVYIMCNQYNIHTLQTFLEENFYFGLHHTDVFLFQQGESPMLDLKGRLLLTEKHHIHQEPAGNGYLLKALSQDGLVAEIKARQHGQTQSTFVCSIDNALTKIGDPIFLGFCKQCNAEAGVKLFQKAAVDEPFGVYVSRSQSYADTDGDGKPDSKRKAMVLEQYEMPDNVAHDTLTGSRTLKYNCANLSQYYFKLDFIGTLAHILNPRHHHHHKKHDTGEHKHFRWHPILKAKPRINLATGEKMVPTMGDRNGYRMEQFLSDCFEFSNKVVGLKVPRDELAYIKKLSGPYSPLSVILAIGKLHQSWIKAAGGEFSGNKIATDREDAKCEISPLVSYDGEDLTGQFWMPIELPFYLPSKEEDKTASAAELSQTRQASLHFIDWESTYAKQNLEEELQFALEKVMDTTPAPPNYKGEPAEKWEELLPTPPDSDQDDQVEDVVRESSADGLKRSSSSKKTRTSDRKSRRNSLGGGEEISAGDWLFSRRQNRDVGAALIGSRRMLEEKIRGNCLFSALEDRDRFRNKYDRDQGSARSNRSSSTGVLLPDSPRMIALKEALRENKMSLRTVPPGMQGLEMSEFGVRSASMNAGSSQWWVGPPESRDPKHDKQSAKQTGRGESGRGSGRLTESGRLMSPGTAGSPSRMSLTVYERKTAHQKGVVVPPGLECVIS